MSAPNLMYYKIDGLINVDGIKRYLKIEVCLLELILRIDLFICTCVLDMQLHTKNMCYLTKAGCILEISKWRVEQSKSAKF